ncbi:MAG: folylpolyglutamate synthase/dihydrofolate synthase family protein [Flavitalea sp.]
MTYQETLDYLFTRLPMFSRIGAAAIKADLHNTHEICGYIGNPQTKFKTIHIAGTNGKGSVSHMLASILQICGYKTGLYTSPHLKDFRERIRIDGRMIDEKFVTSFTEKVKPLIEDINPSFFEITVGMAFDYFASERIDIAVIETGLGGRLDSTNVIIPELSIITNIGMDHMNLLGNTLELIAGEKAGIIKKGVPAIIGESSFVTDEVFKETARQKNAPLVFADKLRFAADWKHSEGYLEAVISRHVDSGERINYKLDLPGYYQLKNLVTVLEAVSQLRNQGWHLLSENVYAALSRVKKLTGFHGRWEIIRHHPDIILDVAHNEEGIRQVIAQLELSEYHKLHIVIGMVKDKEVETILQLLPKEAAYYFTRAQIPRALPEDQLKKLAEQSGLRGEKYAEVNMAIQAALHMASPKDLILVCGSVFIVGEVNL